MNFQFPIVFLLASYTNFRPPNWQEFLVIIEVLSNGITCWNSAFITEQSKAPDL